MPKFSLEKLEKQIFLNAIFESFLPNNFHYYYKSCQLLFLKIRTAFLFTNRGRDIINRGSYYKLVHSNTYILTVDINNTILTRLKDLELLYWILSLCQFSRGMFRTKSTFKTKVFCGNN